MLNLGNLFTDPGFIAGNIYAIPFIREMAQYCLDECSSIFLLLGVFYILFLSTIIFVIVAYSILYFFGKQQIQRLVRISTYPVPLNMCIRLIPFGYILTSIVTISQGNTYGKGLIKEVMYTIGIILVYTSITYILYLRLFYIHTGTLPFLPQ